MHKVSYKYAGNVNDAMFADAPGQAAARARLVREWVARRGGAAGGVLAARLVAVLESVERLPVHAPHDAPPPSTGTLHTLTKRIRYHTPPYTLHIH